MKLLLAQTNPFAGAPLPYRECAGIMLLNADNRVWVGRRLPKWSDDRSAYFWQMPQGGIDKDEDARAAAVRELREETGISHADIIAEIPDWLTYDLPPELLGVALKGRYRGQRQRWFAMRFTGEDSEIDISAVNGLKAEFDDWRWAEVGELSELIVPFKREIYKSVVAGFRHLIPDA